MSHSASGRENSFREGLRERDGKCVISGIPNLNWELGVWDGFQGAHIFPLEMETIWIKDNFGSYITDLNHTIGISKINSCQNGLLMQSNLHTLFDNYLFSVNPDVSNSTEDIIICH
jgi:hypothetical protein